MTRMLRLCRFLGGPLDETQHHVLLVDAKGLLPLYQIIGEATYILKQNVKVPFYYFKPEDPKKGKI